MNEITSNPNILPASALMGLDSTAADSAASGDSAAVEKAAKGFESVLLQKVLEEMRNTIPDSGLLSDGTSKQMQDMFWMFLADDLGSKGGIGLWKELSREFTGAAASQADSAGVDSLGVSSAEDLL